MKITGPVHTVDGVDYQLGIRHIEKRDTIEVFKIRADADPDQYGEYTLQRAAYDTNVAADQNAKLSGQLLDGEWETLALLANGAVIGLHRSCYVNKAATEIEQRLLPEFREKGFGTVYNHLLRKYAADLGVEGFGFKMRADKVAAQGLANQIGAVVKEQVEGKTGMLDVYEVTKEANEARLLTKEAEAELAVAYVLSSSPEVDRSR